MNDFDFDICIYIFQYCWSNGFSLKSQSEKEWNHHPMSTHWSHFNDFKQTPLPASIRTIKTFVRQKPKGEVKRVVFLMSLYYPDVTTISPFICPRFLWNGSIINEYHNKHCFLSVMKDIWKILMKFVRNWENISCGVQVYMYGLKTCIHRL